jgi:hypothetical protein
VTIVTVPQLALEQIRQESNTPINSKQKKIPIESSNRNKIKTGTDKPSRNDKSSKQEAIKAPTKNPPQLTSY